MSFERTTSKLIIKNLSDTGIDTSSVIYIHRGRNKQLTQFFAEQYSGDYNYDFRGLKLLKFLNPLAHIFKSLITALEIEKSKYYLVEGGLFILIAVFLKIFNPNSKIIFNFGDATLAQMSQGSLSKLKYFIKLKLLNYFDVFLTNGLMIRQQLLENNFKQPIFSYYLPIFKDNIELKENSKKSSVLFLITRPHETGKTKGLDIAIKIAQKMQESNKDIKFIFGGSGTENLNIKNLNNVSLMGHFYDVTKAYKMANILICPSYYDAYASVTVECVAEGVIPIVSSTTGSGYDLSEYHPRLVIKNRENIDEWIDAITFFDEMARNEKKDILCNLIKFINKVHVKCTT